MNDIPVWKTWQDAGHLARGCDGWSQDFLSSEVVPMPAAEATT